MVIKDGKPSESIIEPGEADGGCHGELYHLTSYEAQGYGKQDDNLGNSSTDHGSTGVVKDGLCT